MLSHELDTLASFHLFAEPFISFASTTLSLILTTLQLEDTQPGPAYLESLATAIDAAEAAITSVKNDQITTYGDLISEQNKLERQLADLADAIEAEDAAERTGAGCDGFASSSGAPAAATVQQQHQQRRQSAGVEVPEGDSFVLQDTGEELRGGSSGMSGHGQGSLLHGMGGGGGGGVAHTKCCSTGSRGSSSGGSRGAASGGILPEVLAYERFVERTGATGGWHEDDHAAWVALLRRCKGDYTRAVVAAEERIPTMTREQVTCGVAGADDG